ncbi:MAG TPA: hypothetical protein VIJ14_02295, partial [Rhabdochlamydiaceae bacterium]
MGKKKEIKKRHRRTDQELAEEALKYTRRVDFQNGSNSYFKQAWRRKEPGFLDKICSHMELMWEIKWNTFDKLKVESIKYDSRGEFRDKSPSAYGAAIKRDDYEEICSHMKDSLTAAWTLEELKIRASFHVKKTDFAKSEPGAYEAALNHEKFDEICSHMPKTADFSGKNNPRFKWEDDL